MTHRTRLLFCAALLPLSYAAAEAPFDAGSRLHLMLDRSLIGTMQGVELRMHTPVEQPRAKSTFTGNYATVIKDGEVTWPAPPITLPAPPPKPAAAAMPKAPAHGHGASEPMSAGTLAVVFGLGALAFLGVGLYAPAAFLGHFTVFVLACFVGYMVVWNVTPALHTPLMSVTNAISSIIAIGALVQIAPPAVAGTNRPDELIRWIAIVGIALTTINMFGGFAVTRRMLAMFRK